MVSYCFAFLLHWHFRTVGWWPRNAFLGGLVVLGLPAGFSVAASFPFSSGSQIDLAKNFPMFSWETGQSASMAGVAVHYQSFSSPLTVAKTAKQLTSRVPLFRRAIVFRNKTVLSGMHDGWHWVAEIDVFGRGARGVISALPMTPGLVAKQGRFPMFDCDWLPASATIKFEHRIRNEGQVVVQLMYAIGLPVAQTLTHVISHLMRAGWTRATLNQTPGMQQWQLKEKHLVFAVLPDSGVSTLFIQYSH